MESIMVVVVVAMLQTPSYFIYNYLKHHLI